MKINPPGGNPSTLIEDAMSIELHHGDCLDIMPTLEAGSVDSIVTDPPYGLSFMGKDWDHGVPGEAFWVEALRVAKPGAYLLAFGGTRMVHRLAVAIEDAGWEIRDRIHWCYGSGFPKSLSVGKSIDREERDRWLKVGKAIDNIDQTAIMGVWKKRAKTASNAGLSFQSEPRGAGQPMSSCGSAPARVLLQANPENNDAVAIIAELSSIEAHHTPTGTGAAIAPTNADASKQQSPAKSAENLQRNDQAKPTATGIVQFNVREWPSERTGGKHKAVEALKIWLGGKKSSRKGDTDALCAALTEDLKVTTLRQSKTFQSLDTSRQTECASAINATITESTAASLISFTVDILRRKAIDKAAGAEREVVRVRTDGNKGGGANTYDDDAYVWDKPFAETAPATEAAKQWDGWGTALKPAVEPIIMARKPLIGTVAANVLEHGTGAINVDGCRVGTSEALGRNNNARSTGTSYVVQRVAMRIDNSGGLGRWPANLIHDGSDEVVGLFPNDAARFFYCAKASKRDRDDDNKHPTVKPTDLMRYLCRLVTPPGGVVLDPFTGSGSTGKAARLEGFNFIGIEKDADYFAIASKRINQHSGLFNPSNLSP